MLSIDEIIQGKFEKRAKSRAHIREDMGILHQDEVPELEQKYCSYSQSNLVTQTVKRLLPMLWEIWICSLG